MVLEWLFFKNIRPTGFYCLFRSYWRRLIMVAYSGQEETMSPQPTHGTGFVHGFFFLHHPGTNDTPANAESLTENSGFFRIFPAGEPECSATTNREGNKQSKR